MTNDDAKIAEAVTADPRRIRVGAGFGILPPAAPPAELADSGRVRVGAGFGLSPIKAR